MLSPYAGASRELEHAIQANPYDIDALARALSRALTLDREAQRVRMRALREVGQVGFLGVSVYTVAEAEAALGHPDMDILQVPCNVWDQRMQTAGVFAEARRRGKICFVRSIFLQGLLTLPREEAARRVPAAAAAAAAWEELLGEHGCPAVELAVRYAVACESPLVIGADTARQAAHNGALLELPPLGTEAAAEIRARVAPHLSEEVINPSRWPAG